MNYDKNSFLAGISVGRTLSGLASGGNGDKDTQDPFQNWTLLTSSEISMGYAPKVVDMGFECGVYYVIFYEGRNTSSYTSKDGVSWDRTELPGRPAWDQNSLYSYGNNTFAYTSRNGITYTRDFVNWNEVPEPTPNGYPVHFEFDGDILWFFSSYESPPPDDSVNITYVYFTPDLEKYTTLPTLEYIPSEVLTTPIGFVTVEWSRVAGEYVVNFASFPRYGSGGPGGFTIPSATDWVMFSFLNRPVIIYQADEQTVEIKVSTDFCDWDGSTINLPSNGDISVYTPDDGSLWITRDNGNTYAVTKDLITFRTVNVQMNTSCPIYFMGTYFLTQGSGICKSKDLITWETIPDIDGIRNLYVSGGVIFATGNGTVNYDGYYASTDGENWEALPIKPTSVFGKDGVFIAYERLSTGSFQGKASVYVTVKG